MSKIKRADWQDREEEVREALNASDEMAPLYEESFKPFEEGAILQGTVVALEGDGVVVDIGYKSEAVITPKEFSKEELAALKVGERLPVFLEALEDTEGRLLVSKEKAEKAKIWEEIETIYRNNGSITGKVIAPIKGGVVVDIGVKAFLPGSQIDLRPPRHIGALVGRTFPVKIVKMSPRRGNIIVSRKALLEKNRDENRNKVLASLQEGQVVEGVVKNITGYGAFIDLGGIDGLLHITDMSWSRVSHPSDYVKVGEKVSVVILKYDREASRVSLGMKQKSPDPWDAVEARYSMGMRVTGRVINAVDYGIFVEIEPGVEGLVHISDLSWGRDVTHPSKVISPGETVSVVLLNIDRKARRLSLSMKQAESNPWDQVEQKYPVGSKISGKVRSLTDFGVFVGIEEGLDGLIHFSDLSWSRYLKHPSEMFKRGQEIEAVILKVDRERGRISLGYKQCAPDPWQEVSRNYPVGTVLKGQVIKHTDFGFFVAIENGVEGLVYRSKRGAESADQFRERYPVGQEIMVRVARLQTGERKMALSLPKEQDSQAPPVEG